LNRGGLEEAILVAELYKDGDLATETVDAGRFCSAVIERLQSHRTHSPRSFGEHDLIELILMKVCGPVQAPSSDCRSHVPLRWPS
jgi:hypothetical protein